MEDAVDKIVELTGAYMLKEHVTKRQLADYLGFKSTTTLNNKLAGLSEFSLEEAGRLASLLGCTVDDFLSTES